MIKGVCICGKTGWEFDGTPDFAKACNCQLCRRYGVLWAYEWENERIRLHGPLTSFHRTDMNETPMLETLFCPECGCVTAWRSLGTDEPGRKRCAVNLRLAEPDQVAGIRLIHFDGLGTFKNQPEDGMTVADIWY